MRLAVLGLALGLALAACASRAAKVNELIAKTGQRHVEFRAPLASATFCKACGNGAPVTLTFGTPPNQIVLAVPLCYAHQQAHVGDKDHFTVTDASDSTTATTGELDITDCITSHVTGKLAASFASGLNVDVKFDTALTEP
jgi:hypothetical protein|nr:hypothetical protein [Kofleriaceae bacterium]